MFSLPNLNKKYKNHTQTPIYQFRGKMDENKALNKIINTLHPLERRVLKVLPKTNDLERLSKLTQLSQVEVMRAMQWLQNKKIVVIKQDTKEIIRLDSNGENYKKNGLPEKKLLESLKTKDLTLQQAKDKAGLNKEELNVCLGLLRQKAAIVIVKEKDLMIKITEQGKRLLESDMPEEIFLQKDFPVDVNSLSVEEKNLLQQLKKRKMMVKVEYSKQKAAQMTELGAKLVSMTVDMAPIEDRVTSAMLKDGSWKKKKFRAYDVKADVPSIFGGKRHFINQAIRSIKRIWLDMGFREMDGPSVQTSFWDLDALFVPQDHPARAMQDTFYIKNPSHGKLPSAELVKRVKAAHENGWTTGSLGWQDSWSEDIAKQNLMITHDTYLSAKVLASIKLEDLPIKTFQVMKVFRNEVMDWKHLFEFYQVGGIVVDENANFSHLKAYLRTFYSKMGYSSVRIRPAHFPYTEPSAEVDVWNEEKQEWVELGGAGIFRPEVVKPLLGKDIPVLAWGLGLERIITMRYKFSDLRDLYKNDIKQLRETNIWV